MDRRGTTPASWLRAGLQSLVAASLLVLAVPASGDEEGWVTLPFTPFQLAIAPGYGQVFSKATPVYGLRFAALYGIQSEVVGLDVGLFSDADSRRGLAIGLCPLTRMNGVGLTLGAGCSQSEGDFIGAQTGAVNGVTGQLKGVQLGLANSAGTATGLQIGLVNGADSMRGLQIGLLNWNKNGLLPFLPIFNFGY